MTLTATKPSGKQEQSESDEYPVPTGRVRDDSSRTAPIPSKLDNSGNLNPTHNQSTAQSDEKRNGGLTHISSPTTLTLRSCFSPKNDTSYLLVPATDTPTSPIRKEKLYPAMIPHMSKSGLRDTAKLGGMIHHLQKQRMTEERTEDISDTDDTCLLNSFQRHFVGEFESGRITSRPSKNPAYLLSSLAQSTISTLRSAVDSTSVFLRCLQMDNELVRQATIQNGSKWAFGVDPSDTISEDLFDRGDTELVRGRKERIERSGDLQEQRPSNSSFGTDWKDARTMTLSPSSASSFSPNSEAREIAPAPLSPFRHSPWIHLLRQDSPSGPTIPSKVRGTQSGRRKGGTSESEERGLKADVFLIEMLRSALLETKTEIEKVLEERIVPSAYNTSHFNKTHSPRAGRRKQIFSDYSPTETETSTTLPTFQEDRENKSDTAKDDTTGSTEKGYTNRPPSQPTPTLSPDIEEADENQDVALSPFTFAMKAKTEEAARTRTLEGVTTNDAMIKVRDWKKGNMTHDGSRPMKTDQHPQLINSTPQYGSLTDSLTPSSSSPHSPRVPHYPLISIEESTTHTPTPPVHLPLPSPVPLSTTVNVASMIQDQAESVDSHETSTSAPPLYMTTGTSSTSHISSSVIPEMGDVPKGEPAQLARFISSDPQLREHMLISPPVSSPQFFFSPPPQSFYSNDFRNDRISRSADGRWNGGLNNTDGGPDAAGRDISTILRAHLDAQSPSENAFSSPHVQH
ncbi:hypothetical protein BLNAU_5926 [Blattamonas nauphoetae]|uniref:Uncharacterized protein n=1 Tax=Blattamonas nauphoetae TaxID=2049346 RepID=A0ABQ9Y5X1_9EUKA|nr:hypothetical protein BLNAU_5926 [Blattamonas nauphoetae]